MNMNEAAAVYALRLQGIAKVIFGNRCAKCNPFLREILEYPSNQVKMKVGATLTTVQRPLEIQVSWDLQVAMVDTNIEKQIPMESVKKF